MSTLFKGFFLFLFIGFSLGARAQDKAVTPVNLKIAMIQINPTVGDFEGNTRKIIEAYNKYEAEGADIIVLPEKIAGGGYPDYDLVERPEFLSRTNESLKVIAEATKGKKAALVVGIIRKTPYQGAKQIQNALAVFEDGKDVFAQAKSLLPTYNIFDEARYFAPEKRVKIWKFKGIKIALGICEDFWFYDKHGENLIYDNNIIKKFKKLGAQLAISLSASPFNEGKTQVRDQVHSEVARELSTPLVYVNMTGATDEVIFDGDSFVLDAEGNKVGSLAKFQEDSAMVHITPESITMETSNHEQNLKDFSKGYFPPFEIKDELDAKISAIVMGMREYVRKTGHTKVIAGSSGGIDSAVTLALADMALGSENVYSIGMPTEYSSKGSVTDAQRLAENFGFHYRVEPIQPYLQTYRDGHLPTTASRWERIVNRVGNIFKRGNTTYPPANELALENLQARIRANLLFAESNATKGMLVLATGNKSELAMGYTTLYGDMAGALSPNGDLYKTDVYAVARRINEIYGREMVPQAIINKEPSHELSKGAVTSHDIPPYWALDKVLKGYLEENKTVQELTDLYGPLLIDKGWAPTWVHDSIKKVEVNEFKRNQASVILRVTRRAFGIGRRFPNTAIVERGRPSIACDVTLSTLNKESVQGSVQ